MKRKTTPHPGLSPENRALVADAIRCMEAVYRVNGAPLTSPKDVRDYLKLRLYGIPYEVFACIWLDNRHRVLRFDELFRGTIDGASVHPREIVRAAMDANAAAVILAHFVARNIMRVMCPVFLCASSGRPKRGSRTPDRDQGT